jgi:hypothetical protein
MKFPLIIFFVVESTTVYPQFPLLDSLLCEFQFWNVAIFFNCGRKASFHYRPLAKTRAIANPPFKILFS